MRLLAKSARFAVLLLSTLVSAAFAQVNVTSHTTTAGTNAFAPLSQGEYFEQQMLTDVSPAVADVSVDWIGPNVGGVAPTWRWIGSAHASFITTSSANHLTATGAGSFSTMLTSTPDFIDPRNVTSVYTPGAGADYDCFFTLDSAATYSVSIELRQWSKVFLGSFESGFIFNHVNHSPTPTSIELTGSLSPGSYQIGVNSSLAALNFANGVNEYVRSGSFANFNFTVQVPEPSTSIAVTLLVATAVRRRNQRCTLNV